MDDIDANLENTWHQNPDLIRQFLERRPDYEQLGLEVTYILNKRLKEWQIETSMVTSRAKSLNSFIEKIQRKRYVNPFDEIKDFAGIRVVHLYKEDALKIEELIRSEFEILEKVDKLDEKDVDRFGYLATHFVARLGSSSSGARYEDLKYLEFEIQVRSVLQDAWAIIDHHLAYKRESDIPKLFQRKLIRIAGMFEMADEQFDEINRGIKQYILELNEASNKDTKQFLNNRLDLDSFIAYLSWRFPGVPLEGATGQAERYFAHLDKKKYTTLMDLEKAIRLADKSREEIDQYLTDNGRVAVYAAVEFYVLLSLVDEEYFQAIKGLMGMVQYGNLARYKRSHKSFLS